MCGLTPVLRTKCPGSCAAGWRRKEISTRQGSGRQLAMGNTTTKSSHGTPWPLLLLRSDYGATITLTVPSYASIVCGSPGAGSHDPPSTRTTNRWRPGVSRIVSVHRSPPTCSNVTGLQRVKSPESSTWLAAAARTSIVAMPPNRRTEQVDAPTFGALTKCGNSRGPDASRTPSNPPALRSSPRPMGVPHWRILTGQGGADGLAGKEVAASPASRLPLPSARDTRFRMRAWT